MFESHTTICVSANQIASTLDDETIVLDFESGQYFGIEGIGKDIWESLQSPSSIQEICDTLLGKYEVDPAQCQSDVTEFVSTLHEAGLITIIA